MNKNWLAFKPKNSELSTIYVLLYTYSHETIEDNIKRHWQVSQMYGLPDDYTMIVMMIERIVSMKVACPTKRLVQIPFPIIDFIKNNEFPDEPIISP